MGTTQNWTPVIQYPSGRSTFLTDLVLTKKVQYGNIFLLAWRLVFGNIRFREGVDISTLPTVLTADPRRVGWVLCRWANKLDELTLVCLIYKSAMIVLALLDIFRGQWKKVAYIFASSSSPVKD